MLISTLLIFLWRIKIFLKYFYDEIIGLMNYICFNSTFFRISDV